MQREIGAMRVLKAPKRWYASASCDTKH